MRCPDCGGEEYRGNPDLRLRELERQWAGGDYSFLLPLVRECLRSEQYYSLPEIDIPVPPRYDHLLCKLERANLLIPYLVGRVKADPNNGIKWHQLVTIAGELHSFVIVPDTDGWAMIVSEGMDREVCVRLRGSVARRPYAISIACLALDAGLSPCRASQPPADCHGNATLSYSGRTPRVFCGPLQVHFVQGASGEVTQASIGPDEEARWTVQCSCSCHGPRSDHFVAEVDESFEHFDNFVSISPTPPVQLSGPGSRHGRGGVRALEAECETAAKNIVIAPMSPEWRRARRAGLCCGVPPEMHPGTRGDMYCTICGREWRF